MYQQKRPRTEGGGGEPDWTCPECGNVNYASRVKCNMRKCGALRPGPLAEGSPGAIPGQEGRLLLGGPPGTPLAMGSPGGALQAAHFQPQQPMYLSPSHLVPATLQHPQPMFYDSPGAGLQQIAYLPQSGPAYPGMAPVPPSIADGYLQSAAAVQAMFHYAAPMQLGPAPLMPEQDGRKRRAGGGDEEAGLGDWVCPACGNLNFSSRPQCNMRKCKGPRPPQGYQPLLPPRQQPYPPPVPTHIMHQHVLPYPQQLQQPQQRQQASPQGGAIGGPAPEGSWTCKVCGNLNYPNRTKCNKRTCGVARDGGGHPNGAGAPEGANGPPL